MNFIFDIGNVLVDFKPRVYLEKLFPNDFVLREKMRVLVFEGPEWQAFDMGTLSHAQGTRKMILKDLSHERAIIETMGRVLEMLTPILPTMELLPVIRDKGHRLFFLSNYHKELCPYLFQTYPCFSLFEGGVFSCDVHELKPDPAIYHTLMNKYRLKPEDCVFFDDLEVNTRGAQAVGIRGVPFQDASDVERILNELRAL